MITRLMRSGDAGVVVLVPVPPRVTPVLDPDPPLDCPRVVDASPIVRIALAKNMVLSQQLKIPPKTKLHGMNEACRQGLSAERPRRQRGYQRLRPQYCRRCEGRRSVTFLFQMADEKGIGSGGLSRVEARWVSGHGIRLRHAWDRRTSC